MPIMLVILFFITAALYASVGFGGGSTYNALLVLYGADYRILPSIALLCNIIVVAGGSYQSFRAGNLRLKRLLPFVITSVPAALIGGLIVISKVVFVGVLGFSLLAAGLHLALDKSANAERGRQDFPPLLAAAIGGFIGFVSGLVGIGGGIFLAPVLYFMRWGKPKEIAGAASVFILVNSISGLAGQVSKLSNLGALELLGNYWALFPSVLIGGFIGSRLSNTKLSSLTVKRLTAALILYVSARLLIKWVGMLG